MAEQATSRAGKPISVGDQVTVVGTVTALGTLQGATTTVTVKTAFSGVSLSTVQAGDCYSTQNA